MHRLEVSARLKMTREALRLTQTRLCEITGISTAAWNNVEKRQEGLGLNSAFLLCDGLGLTLDWIYRGRRDCLPQEIRDALARYERDLAKRKR